MAGSSVIGALRVELGLDSGKFTSGLKASQSALGQFGKVAAVGFASVAAGAAVALGALTKGAIDHADALGKAAQKAGLSVEALSRLEYAAKLSDVSLEGLTGGLQKLSKSMVDVAAGGGEKAKLAFSALGISVTDASGKLRNSGDVFSDVADRVSRLDDGATKIRRSMMLFGKSGADLIPLLNSGADGLARMADESDRLGITVKTKTSKAAEDFNDSMTKVSDQLAAIGNQIIEKITPALAGIAETLTSPAMQSAISGFASMIADNVGRIITVAETALRILQNLGREAEKNSNGYRTALEKARNGMSSSIADPMTGA